MTHKAVKMIGAALVIIFAAGCGGAAGSNSSGFTEEGDDYHRPDDNPIEVVYGIDNRGEACLKCDPSIAHPDLQLQNLANSVGILIRPQALITEAGGETMLAAYPLGERIERMYQAPLCEGERFADQPAPGFCTGFLVGEDIFVTAAHCIPDQLACDQTKVVFNYQVGEGGEIARLNEQSNVYGCEKLVEHGGASALGDDLAVVKLDRSVDRPVLPMAENSVVYIGMSLGVIGHPSGLPQKIADGGRVISLIGEGEYFVSSLDVFAGSSGSPVISLESYQVVGMLVGGEQDYWLTDEGCYSVKQCAGNGEDCSGELIFNLSSLDLLLSALID